MPKGVTTRLVLLLLVPALAACHERSPRMQFVKSLEELVSWSAASRLTVDRWERRAAPTAYTLHTLEEAQQDVHEQTQSLAALDGIDASARDRARAASERVAALCASLSAAVERSDGAAAAIAVSRLADVEQELRAMARGVGP